MNNPALIGYVSPIVILGLFILSIGKPIVIRKIRFFILGYLTFFIMAFLLDTILEVPRMTGAIVAGILTPIVYCVAYIYISKGKVSKILRDKESIDILISQTQNTLPNKPNVNRVESEKSIEQA